MILASAENGVLGIFCEKPLAPDLASCDAIVAACERSHVKLAMAFQTRYSPRYEKVKSLIAEGAIGEVLELRGRGKEDRRGGGEDLMVLGVHILDLCHDLLGEPAWCFARVSERGRTVAPGEFRAGAEGIGPLAGDRIDAMFGFEGNPAVAHFATCRPAEPGRRFGLTIAGSKGCIWMGTGWRPPAFLLRDPTWTATGPTAWSPIIGADEGKGQPGATDLAAGNRAIVADLIQCRRDRHAAANACAGGTDGRRDGPGLLRLERAAEHGRAAAGRPRRSPAYRAVPPSTVRPRLPTKAITTTGSSQAKSTATIATATINQRIRNCTLGRRMVRTCKF